MAARQRAVARCRAARWLWLGDDVLLLDVDDDVLDDDVLDDDVLDDDVLMTMS